jgi:hypothetical protein
VRSLRDEVCVGCETQCASAAITKKIWIPALAAMTEKNPAPAGMTRMRISNKNRARTEEEKPSSESGRACGRLLRWG